MKTFQFFFLVLLLAVIPFSSAAGIKVKKISDTVIESECAHH
jgi:hypothetical protein